MPSFAAPQNGCATAPESGTICGNVGNFSGVSLCKPTWGTASDAM
jgi:hypothetical protein